MKCEQCHNCETKVIESRDVADGSAIRRRRECLKCEHRFTTYERLERPHLIIVKKSGVREMFDREKLLAGISRSCDKTPVTSLQVEELVARIEQQLYAKGESEISSSCIGELVMEGLAKLNEVAYVRFASVYRHFKDIESFEKELAGLRERLKAS